MSCWELDNQPWLAEHEADQEPPYPYGPHDYEVDQLQEYLDYHRYGFPMLAADEDPAF